MSTNYLLQEDYKRIEVAINELVDLWIDNPTDENALEIKPKAEKLYYELRLKDPPADYVMFHTELQRRVTRLLSTIP